MHTGQRTLASPRTKLRLRLPCAVLLIAAGLAGMALFPSRAGAESINHALRAAVEAGDAEQVRSCLAEGADPGARFVYRTVDSPETNRR